MYTSGRGQRKNWKVELGQQTNRVGLLVLAQKAVVSTGA